MCIRDSPCSDLRCRDAVPARPYLVLVGDYSDLIGYPAAHRHGQKCFANPGWRESRCSLQPFWFESDPLVIGNYFSAPRGICQPGCYLHNPAPAGDQPSRSPSVDNSRSNNPTFRLASTPKCCLSKNEHCRTVFTEFRISDPDCVSVYWNRCRTCPRHCFPHSVTLAVRAAHCPVDQSTHCGA